MTLQSVNPFSGELIAEQNPHSEEAIASILSLAQDGFRNNKAKPLSKRVEHLLLLKRLILNDLTAYAETACVEMGKPLLEAKAELQKCAELCDYYASHAEEFLKPRSIESSASTSYARYDPIGVILGIMPWNFPYWQVFRFAVPTILAGNAIVLKHASNVSLCAKHIDELFVKAGFDKHEYQTLFVAGRDMPNIICSKQIHGVSLTGSEEAGVAAAMEGAKGIKPIVLELGGSNAFVSLSDADVDLAVKKTLSGRMLNAGQSCIAAKRILVHKDVREAFVERYLEKMERIQPGNPIEGDTRLGPMVSVDAAKVLEEQIQVGISKGAKVLLHGSREGAIFSPWVIEIDDITNPLFQQETFGPVSVIHTFDNEDQIPDLVHASKFGLGVSLFTKDPDRIGDLIAELNEGAVFVNEMVKSESSLPFGGVKRSGIGRELGEEGIRAFTNVKTVYIA